MIQELQLAMRHLIDSTLTTTQVLARDLNQPEPVQDYANVLAAYLTGDNEKLLMQIKKIEIKLSEESFKDSFSQKILNDILLLAQFRLSLRRNNWEKLDISWFENQEFWDVLQAEKFFVLGRAYENQGHEEKNWQANLKASAIYDQYQCPRKKIRALYNSIASESRLHPYKNYVSEYQTIIALSQKIRDEVYEGMALSMLSREYQVIGSKELALASSNKAMKLLENELGSIHYYHALLHHAHILMENNMREEALKNIQKSKLANFPEITAARELLLCGLDSSKSWNTNFEKDLLTTWRERIPDLLSCSSIILDQNLPSKLSGLELKLLKLLWNGPINKWDLIEKLYPNETDSLALENRFKNLVGRIRKRNNNLLMFSEGRYFILTQFKLSAQEMDH